MHGGNFRSEDKIVNVMDKAMDSALVSMTFFFFVNWPFSQMSALYHKNGLWLLGCTGFDCCLGFAEYTMWATEFSWFSQILFTVTRIKTGLQLYYVTLKEEEKPCLQSDWWDGKASLKKDNAMPGQIDTEWRQQGGLMGLHGPQAFLTSAFASVIHLKMV